MLHLVIKSKMESNKSSYNLYGFLTLSIGSKFITMLIFGQNSEKSCFWWIKLSQTMWYNTLSIIIIKFQIQFILKTTRFCTLDVKISGQWSSFH